MSKHLLIKLGVAASLCVAAIPVLAYADTTPTTQVTIKVKTSISCQSEGNTNTTDVNMGEVEPGTTTQAPTNFILRGTTNSVNGFKITGTPTDLIYTPGGSPTAGPLIAYKYEGMDPAPTGAFWWVTTTESAGVTIADKINLTTTEDTKAFSLGANASVLGTTPAGTYVGSITWTCTAL